MARALASSGGAAADAGFVQPWLAVLGVALVSVWAVTLAVLLCGDGSEGRRRRRRSTAAGAVAAAAGDGGAGCGASGGGGGCGGGGGGGC